MPYSTPIFTKLGTTVTAGGLPSSDPDSFQFDLFTTLDDEGVALNITTQFTDDDGSVVMNSRQDGKWGQEETANSFPFKKGMNFVLAIVTTAQEYTIVVNDEILYSFRLRSPLETVKRYGISQKANKDDASLKISSVATNVRRASIMGAVNKSCYFAFPFLSHCASCLPTVVLFCQQV